MRQFALVVALAIPILAATHNVAATEPVGLNFGLAKEPVSFAVTHSHSTVTPGQQFYVAVQIRPDAGWFFYGPAPGDGPKAAAVTLFSPKWPTGAVLWPPDRLHETDLGNGKAIRNFGYDKEAAVYLPIVVPQDASAGPLSLKLRLTGQACESLCIDVDKLLETPVTVGSAAVANPAWNDLAGGLAQAAAADKLPSLRAGGSANTQPAAAGRGAGPSIGTDLSGLGLALLAGLVLNIMPCVLPVIPLKVMSIVQQAKESRRRFITLGLTFAGGVVLFFVAVAVLNIVLKVALQSTFNWGEHFQYLAFRMGMALLMVALAANLFGAFTVLAPRRVASMEVHREGHLSALGMGFITGVLSTPCSFAWLTAAFVWAQDQPLWLGSLGIVTIGVGMALPYALLTAFPDLVRRLPRPGRWMELFKQAMGFVLLLVAVWLISTGAGDAYPFWVAAFGVVLAFCLWMWGTWVRFDDSLGRKLVIRGLALAVAIGCGLLMLTPGRPLAVQFHDFDAAAIAAAQKQGRIVLVDFTASWCVNCKVVETRVYDDPAVAQELRRLNVLVVRGDVTEKTMPANSLKEQLSEAIPVTVLLPPDGRPPIRLRGIFSKEQLFEALSRLSDGKQGVPSRPASVANGT